MSDTPETDNLNGRLDYSLTDAYLLMTQHSRKMERERSALKNHISIMDASRKIANDEYLKLAVENEKLELERDGLRKALSLAGKRCHEAHHPKSMQHGGLDPCPVEALIQQALYQES